MKWLIIFISLILFAEFYAFIGTKNMAAGNRFGYIFYIAYGISVLLFVLFFVLMFSDFTERSHVRTPLKNFFYGFVFTIFVTKLVFATFMLFSDVVRLGFYAKDRILNEHDTLEYSLGRRKFVTQIGLAIAALPFASFFYGITKGKYNFEIKRLSLAFNDLPSPFHKLKIVQISDIHAGSFDDADEVKRGVEMVNDLNPDIILFTGDLVNNRANEIEPYLDIFSQLSAKYGKFSVLGNHDYGDYMPYQNEEERTKNLSALFDFHKKLGFNLLNNDNRKINIDEKSIVIAGVENWGKKPFPQYGNLSKAFANINDDDFVLLMSHDPSHWDEEILPHKKHVHLTLSGHTHGMQFGIDIPGIKWSPVKYRYPRWAGLYSENNQHLYVNKGFGFLGFPGRVGMWPEITYIELNQMA